MLKRVKKVLKKIVELGKRAASALTATVLTAISLIILVVIGTFIAFSVEDVMKGIGGFNESTWYDIYTNFVSTVQNVFPLIAIAVIVLVCMFILGYVLRSVLGGGGT